MKLFFEVTAGDRKGSRFEIRDGASIGRKSTDIIIRDSKISSRHAQVEERDSGFYLTDAGSSNGLKIEGNRVTEVHLLPGVAIQLGRTYLTVIDLDEVGETVAKPIVGTWQQTVAAITARMEGLLKAKPQTLPLQMFAKPVELTAVAGPQTGQTWTIVYGPRDVGADSLDVRLLESGIPATAFSLLPSNNGLMLKTEYADKILVNGETRKSLSGLIVNDGDEIEIQSTRLRVNLRDL